MSIKYRIAILGFGSIGKRHLSNVSKLLTERGDTFQIDIIRRNAQDPLEHKYVNLINRIYSEDDEILERYDAIFITNPTYLHYDSILKFSNITRSMFIEKPLFDRTDINIENLSRVEDKIYYVACPLRYTSVIQYLKNQLDLTKVRSTRVICSSYLPDWRPNIDYRETYSAHADQGGGVSIDLIHEWDYVIYLFGKPIQVANFRGKFSSLEIESDDLSVYIAKYERLLAEVHLDYFGRKQTREIQLFTDNETIIADLINNEIKFLRENRVIHFNEERNEYQIKELINFFDILEGNQKNENDISTAYVTLRIAKEGIVL